MASDDQIKRVLVTGASGFIATHIIQQLLQAGYKVRGTVRSLGNETKVKNLKGLCPDAAHELELVEADLSNAQCWISAVDGCSHVLHVASPFPVVNPADENELIRPAVQGTTFVLKACADVGTVKRVVVTSSVVAVMDPINTKSGAYTEEDWPDVAAAQDAYNKSKTLAEKAAWEFVNELPADKRFELSVVNPGYVIGPMLHGSSCTSMELFKRILEKNPPGNIRLNVGVVDVRDVAKAHIAAMTTPEAAGHRHLLVTDSMWMVDFAQIIKDEFEQHGYSITTMVIPKPIFNIVALFDSGAKGVKSMWGKEFKYDNSRMKDVLKIDPIPCKTSVIDMAYSIIDGGYTKKHKHYKGRPTLPQDQQTGTNVSTSNDAYITGDVEETGGKSAEISGDVKVTETNAEVIDVAEADAEVKSAETNGEVQVTETNAEVHVAETDVTETDDAECAENNTQTDEPEN